MCGVEIHANEGLVCCKSYNFSRAGVYYTFLMHSLSPLSLKDYSNPSNNHSRLYALGKLCAQSYLTTSLQRTTSETYLFVETSVDQRIRESGKKRTGTFPISHLIHLLLPDGT